MMMLQSTVAVWAPPPVLHLSQALFNQLCRMNCGLAVGLPVVQHWSVQPVLESSDQSSGSLHSESSWLTCKQPCLHCVLKLLVLQKTVVTWTEAPDWNSVCVDWARVRRTLVFHDTSEIAIVWHTMKIIYIYIFCPSHAGQRRYHDFYFVDCVALDSAWFFSPRALTGYIVNYLSWPHLLV